MMENECKRADTKPEEEKDDPISSSAITVTSEAKGEPDQAPASDTIPSSGNSPPPSPTPTLPAKKPTSISRLKSSSLPLPPTSLNESGDLNAGMYTRVNLRVRAETRLGEQVHCSGSSFMMGQYNPNESMVLITDPEMYPVWVTSRPLILPRGVPHHYVYAIFSGGSFNRWEDIPCDRRVVPEGREMTIKEDYGVYHDRMILAPKEVLDNNNSPTNSQALAASGRSMVYDRTIPVSDRSSTSLTNAASVSAADLTTNHATLTGDDHLDTTNATVGQEEESHRTFSLKKPQHFRANFPHHSNVASRFKRFQSAQFKPLPDTTLYLICFHLPVKLKRDPTTSKWQVAWNHDSLIAKSEGSVAENMKVQWIGCITHESCDEFGSLTEDDRHQISAILLTINCVAIFIDPAILEDHYQGYCKSHLWPMFHNVDVLDINSAIWEKNQVEHWEKQGSGKWKSAYRFVNQAFADVMITKVKPVDILWVHDYHLLLFGADLTRLCLDQKRQRPKMVLFIHVPFPTSEIFRELSNGPELLEGMLSVDLVGFHSFDHARHFLNACKRFLGLSYQSRRGGDLGVDFHGRNVTVTITHVGLETKYISQGLDDPDVDRRARALREKHAGKILICGVDKCQRLSGVPLKLLAMEQLVHISRVWRDKVVLVQRCIRMGYRHGDQNHSSSEIKCLVDRINSKYGLVIDYEEVEHFELKDRLVLWRASDIMLHTAIRGGLNVKPLEYVFARGYQSSCSLKSKSSEDQQLTTTTTDPGAGVVVLSEFSGCCCVLNGALRINPWNLSQVTSSLDQALGMSMEERVSRRARDIEYITKKSAASWTRQVLLVLQEATLSSSSSADLGEQQQQQFSSLAEGGLELVRNTNHHLDRMMDFTMLDSQKILQAYRATSHRVFLLDYGGTIIARENMSMYVKKDFTAVSGRAPSTRMMQALTNLSADPRNVVFIISGVSQVNLSSVLGHIKGLGLASQWEKFVFESSQNRECAELSTDFDTERRPTTTSETTKDSSVWQHHHQVDFCWDKVRQAVDPILRAYQSRTNGSILQYLEQGIAWNFRSTDPEWGLMQANHLQQELLVLLEDFPVTIIRKKGLLEIVPEGLHKGIVARRILSSRAIRQHGNPDFIFCIGDDTTDEMMFKSIYEYIAERSEESIHGGMNVGNSHSSTGEGEATTLPALPKTQLEHVFTCTVGKKQSHAHLYVNGVCDVENLFYTLGEQSSST